MSGVDDFKRQNDELRSGLNDVVALRDDLGSLPVDEVRQRLDTVLAFFRHEVGPHARAEERVFYPMVADMLGVDLGMRMVGEHRYISELVDDVTEARHHVISERVIPQSLYGRLGLLAEVAKGHLLLEEEVLGRMIDRGLTEGQLYALQERMAEATSVAAKELSRPR